MKRLSILLFSLVFLVCLTGVSQAALITIDADNFSINSDISNPVAGVTLSSVGFGWDGVAGDGKVYARTPYTNFVPTTGSLIFGHDDTSFPGVSIREEGFKHFRADFAIGVDEVFIDFLGDNASDYGYLKAYNSSNVLLGTYFTGNVTLGNFETASISGVGNIAYVIAAGTSVSSAMGLDNLRINAVPEPSTLLLLGTGLIGLVGMRRKFRV